MRESERASGREREGGGGATVVRVCVVSTPHPPHPRDSTLGHGLSQKESGADRRFESDREQTFWEVSSVRIRSWAIENYVV